MFKVYYGGRDADDHSNFTRFAVASMTFTGKDAGEQSLKFLKDNPTLFEVGVEIDGRKFNLATGLIPIEFGK